MVTLVSGGKREGMVARPNHPIEKVRELQRKLFIVAKRKRERRFHVLCDRTWRSDDSPVAWKWVRGECCRELYVILKARMPHEKTIGKPDAGNPHVRFERGPQETEPARHRA